MGLVQGFWIRLVYPGLELFGSPAITNRRHDTPYTTKVLPMSPPPTSAVVGTVRNQRLQESKCGVVAVADGDEGEFFLIII